MTSNRWSLIGQFQAIIRKFSVIGATQNLRIMASPDRSDDVPAIDGHLARFAVTENDHGFCHHL